MKFRLRVNARYFNNDELIDDLKRVARLFGKQSISQNEYKKKGKFSCHSFYNRFKSWNNALKKAGLDIVVSKTITNEELFDNLEIIWRRLGRQPYYDEIVKPFSKYVIDTYCRRFGSWIEACKAFIRYKKSDPKFIKFFNTKSTGKSRTINERDRLKIFKRDNYSCTICGKSPSTHKGITLHIDHIKPFSKGGSNNLENLRTLCNKCNLGRGDSSNL